MRERKRERGKEIKERREERHRVARVRVLQDVNQSSDTAEFRERRKRSLSSDTRWQILLTVLQPRIVATRMHTCKRADVSTSRGVVSLRLFFRVSRPRRASVPIFLPVFAKVGVAYRGCLRATGNQETRAKIGRFVGRCPSSLRFHTAPRTCLLVVSSHGCVNRCRPKFLRILRGCKRLRMSRVTEYRLSSVSGATWCVWEHFAKGFNVLISYTNKYVDSLTLDSEGWTFYVE